MSAVIGSPAEYRAFTLLDIVPAGCVSFPVTDQRGAPHLRLGEFAVIDTHDRDPRSGEIYLIEWQGGGRSLVSLKYRKAFGVHGWWIGAPALPWGKHYVDKADALRAAQIYGLIDGPINEAGLKKKLIGRVIGILGAMAEGPMRTVSGEPPEVAG